MLLIKKVKDFFARDIWVLSTKDHTLLFSILIDSLRLITSSISSFIKDRCSLRASALTYYSLLSIVPVFAATFGIAKGFGFERSLEMHLVELFEDQPEVLPRVIEFSNSLLEQAKGGIIAGTGIFLLFWTVIKLIDNIEISFNEIWKIKKSRPWVRKFSDYLAIIVICPLLFTSTSSLTIFLTDIGPNITQTLVLKVLTLFLTWLMFTLIYLVIPNTKVKLSSALTGGGFAAFVFIFFQWLYINFQIGVSRYGAIYGSFAALPLFMVWVQVSWFITLFGAEIACAREDLLNPQLNKSDLQLSFYNKKLGCLMIAKDCVQQFKEKKEAPNDEEIAKSIGLSNRLTKQLIRQLVQARILNQVLIAHTGKIGYQPAFDIAQLTIEDLFDGIEEIGDAKEVLLIPESFSNLREKIAFIGREKKSSKYNLLIKDL